MELNEIINKNINNLTYDEVYYLYITLNYGYDKIAELYHYKTNSQVRKVIAKYNIHKSQEDIKRGIKKSRNDKAELYHENHIKKYKEEHNGMTPEEYNKYKNRSIDTRSFKEKYQDTWNKKQNIDEIVNKRRQTCLERYGVDSPMKTEEVKNKLKDVFIEKYGVDNPMKSNDVKEKFSKVFNDKYKSNQEALSSLIEKRKKTNLERYGYTTPLKDTEKIKAALLKNYGVTNISQLGFVKEKIYYNIYYEDEMIVFLQSLNITNIIRHDRDILDGQEIDIYLPDYKFGIEFNGSYWHSDIRVSQKFHQDKSLKAESKGIFLYHIFEYEWNDEDKCEKIKYQIQNILLHNTEKIYARKCNIKLVDKETKIDFINKNHIQGDAPSSIEIGLYYNNKLISIMTFGKPRFNKHCNYELVRYCSEQNYNIVGGASKLFKYFVDNYMQNNEVCLSYSDIGKTRGKIYETLGFTNTDISYPSYVWCHDHTFEIITRYQAMMKNEIEIMENKRYHRVFDAGNKVWKYKKVER